LHIGTKTSDQQNAGEASRPTCLSKSWEKRESKNAKEKKEFIFLKGLRPSLVIKNPERKKRQETEKKSGAGGDWGMV